MTQRRGLGPQGQSVLSNLSDQFLHNKAQPGYGALLINQKERTNVTNDQLKDIVDMELQQFFEWHGTTDLNEEAIRDLKQMILRTHRHYNLA